MLTLLALLALPACRNKDITPDTGEPGLPTVVDADADGFPEEEDCDDTDPAINPGSAEIPYDGVDNDCDPATPDDDLDGDGYLGAEDCDDEDPTIHPDAVEACNGVDDDCDGEIDDAVGDTWYVDADGDGFGDPDNAVQSCDGEGGTVADSSDCDDGAADVNIAADEVCDGVDNDCDGEADEASAVDASDWYMDSDGDGFGDDDSQVRACDAPSGAVEDDGDCDDSDGAVNPDADEVCDGVDNDCDGQIDDDASVDAGTWYRDADSDGYGDARTSTTSCDQPSGYVTDATDCDDSEASSNPGETEICDELDNDCDGDTDEEVTSTFYEDDDGDGYGDASSSVEACSATSGYVTDATDCDDGESASNPGETEICDELDNDCDGDTDEEVTSTFYEDDDGDGYGDASSSIESCSATSGYVTDATDCDDGESASNPGETEICDELDNDCDGDTDEGVTSTWYLDYDGDGYGDDARTVEACSAPTLYVSAGGDCDDTDSAYSPAATAGCDGEDYDCDGDVDSDADGDGYADASCGGDDCDDSDSSVKPEVGAGCALGTTCDDVLDKGYSAGDGEYTIDPDGYGTGLDPFDVTCDMTTDGGGWTAIEYSADLTFQRHHTGGDAYAWLTSDFTFTLSDAQISAIRALSAEGSQTYVGLCEHVIHYYYTAGASYAYAFGFEFFDGTTTAYASSSYSPDSITVSTDGCAGNGGEGGDLSLATEFDIDSVLVPVINVYCRDCGDAGELFGSPLTDNPAWLR